MKLILSTNASERFQNYYSELSDSSGVAFDYCGYPDLLFDFDSSSERPVLSVLTPSGKLLENYDGVYFSGFKKAYELAATVAVCCRYLEIPFADVEVGNAPSLSKLSMYAKLAAAGVRIPHTIAGTKQAIERYLQTDVGQQLPVSVLKRADADRGEDNFKVLNGEQASSMLQDYDDRGLWILQEYLENDGYYRMNVYGAKPGFCIFRTLEQRPDTEAHKAHMYKPKGGSNARLIELTDVPPSVTAACVAAAAAMDRQVAGVDCIYDAGTQTASILEVNNVPQLVMIESFPEIRRKAMVEFLEADW